jgi:hypothetical protein
MPERYRHRMGVAMVAVLFTGLALVIVLHQDYLRGGFSVSGRRCARLSLRLALRRGKNSSFNTASISRASISPWQSIRTPPLVSASVTDHLPSLQRCIANRAITIP